MLKYQSTLEPLEPLLIVSRQAFVLLCSIFNRLHSGLNNDARDVHCCATLAICVISHSYAFDLTSLAFITAHSQRISGHGKRGGTMRLRYTLRAFGDMFLAFPEQDAFASSWK